MITDFPSNPATNMAGMQSFKFAPYQNVTTLPAAVNKIVSSPVIFSAGNSFLNGYATINTLSFVETGTIDENGPIYSWLLTGFVPGDSDILVNLLDQMARSRHILAAKDFNGRMRLIGSDAPLTFNADYDSGKVPGSDPRGYNFTFSGQSKDRAPFYNV